MDNERAQRRMGYISARQQKMLRKKRKREAKQRAIEEAKRRFDELPETPEYIEAKKLIEGF